MAYISWPETDEYDEGFWHADTDAGLINWGHGADGELGSHHHAFAWLNGSRTVTYVPEPSSLALLAIGLLVIGRRTGCRRI